MKRVTSWMAGLVVMGVAMQALATESGGGAYPNGAEGFMAGALPPPGQYLVNYAVYYGADSMKDNAGHTLPIPFDLQVFADTVRFINVTPVTILGGNWAQHIFVPLVSLDVKTPGGKDHNFGLGDIIVDPFIVGWHKPPFHWVVGMDTYIPVGKYHEDSMANIGRNYWTFEPVVGVTYLNDGGLEASVKMMYDFNTRNNDSATPGVDKYLSGQEFHADFVVAQHLGNWTAGVGGYWYQQTTDDKADGVKVDACRGRALALGPQVSYQYGPMSFALAWDCEFAVENRPQGDKVWFKFVLPL